MKPQTIAQGAEATITLITPRSKKDSPLTTSPLRVGGWERFIIKDRIKKSYRIPELDKKIRTRRTKAEAKLLTKASQIINCPVPFFKPDVSYKIKMPFIDGKKLSEHLDKFPLAKQKQILKQIGKDIAKLHDADIIHGDLTTSNMILVEPSLCPTKLKKCLSLNKSSVKKSGKADFVATNRASAPIIFFIDFGLGFFNGKYEDKAVDIHLLKQALEAKHFKHWKEIY
ncbi:MAG: lipopolysaccharide kinase InaA family protein, partial [Nanoarchaeota archaeon]